MRYTVRWELNGAVHYMHTDSLNAASMTATAVKEWMMGWCTPEVRGTVQVWKGSEWKGSELIPAIEYIQQYRGPGGSVP